MVVTVGGEASSKSCLSPSGFFAINNVADSRFRRGVSYGQPPEVAEYETTVDGSEIGRPYLIFI